MRGGIRLEDEVVEPDTLVDSVLRGQVDQWVGVREGDEAVRDAPVRLTHGVAVAVAVAERRDESRSWVALREELLDRRAQRTRRRREQPALGLGYLERVSAFPERLPQLGLELGFRDPRECDTGDRHGHLFANDVPRPRRSDNRRLKHVRDERPDHQTETGIGGACRSDPRDVAVDARCEELEQRLDRGMDPRRRLVLVESRQQAGELGGRARRMIGERRVSGTTMHRQGCAGRLLDAVVEEVDRSAGRLVSFARALADDVVGTEVGLLLDEERGTDSRVADLLVGRQDQHQVAVGNEAFARERREGDGRRRDLAFHVDAAASPDRAVSLDRGERLDRPVLPARLDDVEMAEERQRRAVAAAAQARQEVRPLGILGHALALDPERLEIRLEDRGCLSLTAGRVGRVACDQPLQQRLRFFGRGIRHRRPTAPSSPRASASVPRFPRVRGRSAAGRRRSPRAACGRRSAAATRRIGLRTARARRAAA